MIPNMSSSGRGVTASAFATAAAAADAAAGFCGEAVHHHGVRYLLTRTGQAFRLHVSWINWSLSVLNPLALLVHQGATTDTRAHRLLIRRTLGLGFTKSPGMPAAIVAYARRVVELTNREHGTGLNGGTGPVRW